MESPIAPGSTRVAKKHEVWAAANADRTDLENALGLLDRIQLE